MTGPARPLSHVPARRRAVERGPEAGVGVISSVAGVAAFLAFLFFAVQLLFNLYATSVVTANAYDAARDVASVRVDHDDPGSVASAQATAERQLRDRLGSYSGRITSLDWSRSTADTVRLRVKADNPNLLLFGTGLLGFDRIDRTVVVRVERFQG